MTRRQRLHDLAAWTLAWPDLPALALGSALAGFNLGGPALASAWARSAEAHGEADALEAVLARIAARMEPDA
jgi:hypothetical protein